MHPTIGDLSATEARELGKEPFLALLLGLEAADVARRLAGARKGQKVRDIFGAEWIRAIGDLSVSQARDIGLASELASLLDHRPQAVGRRLKGAHGRTLLRNAFADRWPALNPAHSGALEELEGYSRVEDLGGGGMCEAMRARELISGDDVFVKRARLATRDAAALSREAQIYEKLERASVTHVLRVRGFHRTAHWVYLITDLADGGDLAAHVAGGTLSRSERRNIGLEVAEGLAELHALGVVHRDLKPQNILLSSGAWKIADFGISKNTVRLVSLHTFQGAGTEYYSAPEQFDGVEAHPSADIYALGRVLSFIQTGLNSSAGLRDPWRSLVLELTDPDPEKRPAIAEILTRFPR